MRKVADLNEDGRVDLVEPYYLGAGFGLRIHSVMAGASSWTYSYQDVNSGYTNSNLQNWRVMDVDGDGAADLVEPFFLGAGSGLRVHYVRSNLNATYTYGYRDVDAGYGNSNLNWKVSGLVPRRTQ